MALLEPAEGEMDVSIAELNDANCKTYLLIADGQAALVDPVRERVESHRRALAARRVTLAWLIDTHTHADHLMLNRESKALLGAPRVMHRESPNPLVDRHVHDGETLALGPASLEVLHTPGHTPDSICLRLPGAILTGDTLLIGGSGRTDFPGGDAGAQYDAATARLFHLPDETVVWPGHDYKGRTSSTIGEERRANARFVGRTREEYVALMASLGLPFPRVQEIAAVPSLAAPVVAARLRAPEPPLVLDVREPEEFVGELGHIEGAILVPMDALERRLPKLAGYVDREIVVVCRAGARSASAAAMLRRAGFARVANLDGGMLAWARASLSVQR